MNSKLEGLDDIRMWRLGWLTYWFAFSVFTLLAARRPGFVPHPESVPYPWAAALIMCGFLGLQTAALSSVLSPLRERRSWRRVVGASVLALLFGLAGTATFVSDMPGYFAGPLLFAATNVIVVPIIALALATRVKADHPDDSPTSRPPNGALPGGIQHATSLSCPIDRRSSHCLTSAVATGRLR